MSALLLRYGVTTSVAAATSFTTSFSGGNESPLSEGGKWDNGLAVGGSWQNMQVSSAHCCAAAASSDSPPPYNDAIAILKSSVFTPTANQCYAERVVHFVGGYDPVGQTHEGGLFICFTLSSGVASGYEFYWSASNAWALIRWNGALNSFTPITTSGSGPGARPVDNDVQRIERSGSTLTLKINGSTVATGTDSTFNSGQCGLQHYATSGATLTSYGSKSFTCGNL